MEYLHFTWIFEVCLYEKQNPYNSELHANLCFIFFSMQYKPGRNISSIEDKKRLCSIYYHLSLSFSFQEK